MNTTISTWIAQERSAYENFNEFIACRLEDAIFRSLAEKMKNDLEKDGKSTVVLPWGTYSAEMKSKGEAGNITPAFEPSKGLMKMLNDDASDSATDQDDFDPEFMKLFTDYVAYGKFDIESEGGKNVPAAEKGVVLRNDEAVYLINEYTQVIASIARDKQRDGKRYRLEVDAVFPHGAFDFEYSDGEIKVTFIPHKVFKQYLKNDDGVADAARDADFSEITETKVTKSKKDGKVA